MNKKEESLLLFLETQAVDKRGIINIECINYDEILISKNWVDEFLEEFERYSYERNDKHVLTYKVKLNDKGWEVVSNLRKERAKRGYIK